MTSGSTALNPHPLYIDGECVERVHTFRFLGVLIATDLFWTDSGSQEGSAVASLPERSQEVQPGLNLLLPFYCSSIENLLTYCTTVWYDTVTDTERLQRVVHAAQKTTGCPLPSTVDIYISHCLSTEKHIIEDRSHPGFELFDLLPSERRCRCSRTKTNRHKNSFYFPKAITILNLHIH